MPGDSSNARPLVFRLICFPRGLVSVAAGREIPSPRKSGTTFAHMNHHPAAPSLI
jgi:hypothetical protein